MKKRLFSPLLAAALAAAVALTAAALPAFADGGEETPITIGQSQEQQAECTCTALCTGDSVNADCPVCGAEEADLTACKGLEAQPATLSNALPATALAAVPEGQIIYVGNESVTNGGYWTTDSNGNVTAYTGGDTPTDNYIHYDVANNTLTLHNATIKESVSTNTSTFIAGAAIGVLNQNGDAELTITLEGTNTIAEVGKGIYVLANSTGGATLTITGDGSLDASARQTGIWVQSNNGDAALFIQNAKVEATGTSYGVNVQSRESSTASLTVDGGSLTASVNANIWFQFGSGASGSGTPTVTVSNNAIVRANGGIANNSSSPIQYETGSDSTGGIVFDGKNGTVYGSVTLQEDLTIGEGESLTLDDGASLNANGHNVIVDGGILDEGIKNNLGDSVKYTPTITTASLPSGTVGTEYSTTLAAEGTAPITWSVSSGSLPEGLSLDAGTGVISGTPTAEGESTFTVEAANDYGSDSREFTLTIGVQDVTGVKLNKNTTTIKVGGTETLTATVEPANATNKAVTWSSDNISVATVDANGLVTAVAEGSATITVTTEDGSKTASCTVTVTTATVPVTGVTLDPTSLTLDVNQTAPLTATITPSDATNQNVTWTSDNPSVATVSGGVVTAVAPGEATITATTADGGFAATCTVTVNKPVLPPQPSDPAPSQPEGSGSTGSTSAAPRQQSPVVHNVSNSSAYRKGEYEFWMKVRTKIVSAGPGEVIEVNARDNDKMPNSVMQALAAKEDVTLRIRWNDGEEIVIPSAAALQEKMRMFYPLSYLAKFDFAQTPAKKVK